jgi:Mrp family chromosome partitioning ATPase
LRRPSGINEHLDLLLAGPIPPNPTEMLARECFGKVMAVLKQAYDYVILDTAPVGLVTDTLQIGRYADVTVFVCRAYFSNCFRQHFGLTPTAYRSEVI